MSEEYATVTQPEGLAARWAPAKTVFEQHPEFHRLWVEQFGTGFVGLGQLLRCSHSVLWQMGKELDLPISLANPVSSFSLAQAILLSASELRVSAPPLTP